MSVGWGDYFPLGYCGMTAQLSARYQLPPEASEKPVYDINHQFWTWHRGRNTVWPHLCSLLLGWIPAVWSMLQVWWSKIILMVSTQKSWWNKIYILFFESILESIFENLQQTSQRELSEVFISLEISIASDTVAVKVPPCLFSKWLKKLN